ncbi:MAG: hypothetical protein AAGC73_02530 [Verrucomicrobiota bacterium]
MKLDLKELDLGKIQFEAERITAYAQIQSLVVNTVTALPPLRD